MDDRLKVTDYVKDLTPSGLTPLGFFEEVLNVGIPTRTYTLIKRGDYNELKLEGKQDNTRHMAYVALHVIALIVFSVFTLIALAVREGLRAKLIDSSVITQYSSKQLSDLRIIFNEKISQCDSKVLSEVALKELDFEQVSDIFSFGKGKLCLHGMKVTNWDNNKIQNTVVVQGRQKGKDDNVGNAAIDWPLEDHKALKGAVVHYFHPELEKVDLEFTLSKPQGILSDDAIVAIAKAIVETTNLLNISKDFKGCRIGDEYTPINKLDLINENINKITQIIKDYSNLKGEKSWIVPLRIYLNYSLKDKVKVQKLFQKKMSTALEKFDIKLKPSKFLSIKDCSAEFYFTNKGGKENIKNSVRFIIDKLIKGESVSVFCSQGKDRSALIVFASLLYLSGDASEENYFKVLNYLRAKRSIVSEYYTDFEKTTFIEPMLAAVKEMLQEEKVEFVDNNPVTRSNSGVVPPDFDDFTPIITELHNKSHWEEKEGNGEKQEGK